MRRYMSTSPVNKILIFSETRGGRILAGVLSREGRKYVFTYERPYQRLKNAIALGPELPLWRKRFVSEELFPSLADRIPSRRNPAYEDYCRQWGIDAKERDPFVLLTTIARRGPSTFVFEAESPKIYGGTEVRAFRKRLSLNQREFEALFGISHATLVKLEAGKSGNTAILGYIETCDRVPAALRWLLGKRGNRIHDERRVRIEGITPPS